MSFQQLDQHINKALAICGYKTPTPIQAQVIPIILEGKDLVASSETGSGKTAAFVLPALHYLGSQPPTKKTRILILTPTRELASQINQAARDFGKFSRFNIITLVGGMPYGPQIRDLSRGADIIIATPGRLMDHIDNKRVDLSNIEMLILDEADRMLDMGFIDDVEYIAKLTPSKRQTLLFSATVDKKLTNVVKHLLKNPVRINLSHATMAPIQIKQKFYKVSSPQQKFRLLKQFLNADQIFKAIIFSATKINADKLANQLRDDGFSAAALHGDLRQNVRNRTIEQMRKGKIQFLVATDVAARGIDIDDVSHVINYDLPRFCEDYVHRIGRTGRAGKAGTAISFVLPTDTRHLKSIERFIGQRLQVLQHAEFDDSSTSVEKEFVEKPFRKDSSKSQPLVSYKQSKDKKKREFTSDNSFKKKRFSSRDSSSRYDRSDKPKTSRFKEKSSAEGRFKREDRSDHSSFDRDRDKNRDRNNGTSGYNKSEKKFSKSNSWNKKEKSTPFERKDDRPKKSFSNRNRWTSDEPSQKRSSSPAERKTDSRKNNWSSNRSSKKSIESGYGPLKKTAARKKRRFANDGSARGTV